MKTVGFIGGGRITKIFLQSFDSSDIEFSSIVVYDTNPEVVATLVQQFPSIAVAKTPEEAAKQSIVFIALHPPVIMETLDKVASTISDKAVVISLAPKITLAKIASKLKTKNIARMIPNATSYINEGFNPITFADTFEQEEKGDTIQILRILGKTFEVEEPKLEAYALLSAMLPTYFWFQWNELSQLGPKFGLTEEETNDSIKQTLEASLKLYFDSGLTPDKIMDLIPVKPIGEHQQQISEIYQTKLTGLFEKIKP
jgi:pyrroline-5-carboxylate reductase